LVRHSWLLGLNYVRQAGPIPNDALPLDVPLLAYADPADGTLMVFAMAPDPVLWVEPSGANAGALRDLLVNLDSRPAYESIIKAGRILTDIGKLPRIPRDSREGGAVSV
jgi:hypothetical protein